MVRYLDRFRSFVLFAAGIIAVCTLSVHLLPKETARRGLVWQSKRVDFQPTIGETQVEARFRFKNESNRPVAITKITSSCGCTTATPSKAMFAPDEEGEIISVFKFEHRFGKQEKRIAVETNAPGHAVTELILGADIPRSIQIEPSTVVWKRNQPLTERVIRVTAMADFEVKSLQVLPTNSQFTVNVNEVEDGKIYNVSVLPNTTARGISRSISIVTNGITRNARLDSLHLTIE